MVYIAYNGIIIIICWNKYFYYCSIYCILKTGYVEFAQLESSADAIHSAIVSRAVAMAAEVRCQLPPGGAQWLHIAYCRVITSHREFYIARL